MTVSGNVDLCLAEAQLHAKNEILKKVVSEFAVMQALLAFWSALNCILLLAPQVFGDTRR